MHWIKVSGFPEKGQLHPALLRIHLFLGSASGNLCPGGTFDNSPRFQPWVQRQNIPSPGGTAEIEQPIRGHSPFNSHGLEPTGFLPSLRDLEPSNPDNPALKRWAILGKSLRDCQSRLRQTLPANSELARFQLPPHILR